MNFRRAIAMLVVCAAVPQAARAQVPPPQPASPTIWSMLGIPQGMYKLNAQMINRRGNVPRLEKKPPVKALADVANLESEVPAIKSAAEIKQAEDLAPQKIKAIRYLATVGCGCYDKDGKVTKALLAAMEDCTDEVRLEAVRAVAVAAQSEYCEICKQRSCCSEEVAAMLSKLAYDRDDQGCFVEVSPEVREAAMQAMRLCCEDFNGEPLVEPVPTPVEGSEPPSQPIEGAPGTGTMDEPPPPQIDSEASNSGGTTLPPVIRLTSRRSSVVQERAEPLATPVSPSIPVLKKLTGTVTKVDRTKNTVELELDEAESLPLGGEVKVYHQYFSGTELSAVLQVVDSRPGCATTRLLETYGRPKVSRGDRIEGWR